MSVAERVSDTDEVCQPGPQVEPSHDAVVVGGAVSATTTVTVWDCGASTLPATSVEKYLTVVVAGTENGPVYTVLEVVGVLPSRV